MIWHKTQPTNFTFWIYTHNFSLLIIIFIINHWYFLSFSILSFHVNIYTCVGIYVDTYKCTNPLSWPSFFPYVSFSPPLFHISPSDPLSVCLTLIYLSIYLSVYLSHANIHLILFIVWSCSDRPVNYHPPPTHSLPRLAY